MVDEMAETSKETVPRVKEVSSTRTGTLSETVFTMEARGFLARFEVAEAVEVVGAARFLGGISYRIQLIIKYEKADNNAGRRITKITVTMHVAVAARYCCLETKQNRSCEERFYERKIRTCAKPAR